MVKSAAKLRVANHTSLLRSGGRLARTGPLAAAPFAILLFVLAGGALAQAPLAQPKSARETSQPQQPQAAPRPAQIDRNGVLFLVRSTLLVLDQANKTGNYTVLRDLGAPGFQTNSAARLGEIFSKQRNEKLDLSGVAAIDPQLSLLPQIEANGLMRMAGFFPSVPTQINFEMLFAPANGQWRLFGLSISLGQAAPVAPQAPQAPAFRPSASRGPPSTGVPRPPLAASATPAPPKPAPAVQAKPPDHQTPGCTIMSANRVSETSDRELGPSGAGYQSPLPMRLRVRQRGRTDYCVRCREYLSSP
jgi:hypothetical protein